MSILKADFGQLVERAMRTPGREGLRPVIEKELLHYDILFALHQNGLLDDLVFQGGTSLRLCHGASRYSEDLDFVGGPDFNAARLQRIADTLKDYLAERYGLEIAIKPPKDMAEAPAHHGVHTDRWQVSVTTNPGRRDLPRQKIKLEVANVPSHDPGLQALQRNYAFLPDGYEDVLLRVESKEEILADKLISFPVTLHTHPRHRDIWDIQWLRQGRTGIAPDLIRAKIDDYAIADHRGALADAIDRVDSIIKSKAFENEMIRFLPRATVEATFGRSGFLDFLSRELRQTFEEAARALDYEGDPSPDEGFTL